MMLKIILKDNCINVGSCKTSIFDVCASYSISTPGSALTHQHSILTKDWYKVPVTVDCPSCGAETRSAGIVMGPSSIVGDAAPLHAGEILKQQRTPLDGFAYVETLGGRTENIERYLVNRFHNQFAFTNGSLISPCEHCGEGLPPSVMRSAVMNGFVHLGQRRLLVNERLLLFSSNATLIQFHGGTLIETVNFPEPDYALLLVCDTETSGGETGTLELWHSIARNDYGLLVRGHDGKEQFRDDLNEDLAAVVAMICDLELVLTHLHLSQPASPYCALAGSLLIKALDAVGYQQGHQETDHA